MSGDLTLPISWGIEDMLYHPQAGISTILVNELRLAGFPDLEDGRIRFGSGSLTTRVAPPSITADWAGSTGGGSEYGSERVDPATTKPVAPVLNSLATDILQMDYHVWAQDDEASSSGSIDACRYLCHQLWRVIHRTATEGCYRVVRITPSPQPKSSLGFHAIMTVEHRTVVVDNLLMYAPPGVKPKFAVSFFGAPAADTVNV